MSPHTPILVRETLAFFEKKKIASFIDGTLGAGGHAEAFLQAHPEIQRYIGMDKDQDALAIAKERLHPFADKITFIHDDFRHMKNVLKEQVDGIFLDLGVSSMQLDRPEKGFSFSKEGPLDMRMDANSSCDAATVVNTFSEEKLGQIFRELGEEWRWKRAASAIVQARKKKNIQTTADLCEVLAPVLTWRGRKGKGIHPLTLIFQALRIYVNDELGAIQEAIPSAIELLAPPRAFGHHHVS